MSKLGFSAIFCYRLSPFYEKAELPEPFTDSAPLQACKLHMHAIVTAIVFFKQRTVCIINVWGCAEILPNKTLNLKVSLKENGGSGGSSRPLWNRLQFGSVVWKLLEGLEESSRRG